MPIADLSPAALAAYAQQPGAIVPRQGESIDSFRARLAGGPNGGLPPATAFIPGGEAATSLASVSRALYGDLTGGGIPLAQTAGSLLPGGVAAGAAALGLGALVAPAAALYGISQAIGVQYPWETGPGEGFISPFTRDIVKDESGKWVTRATRPDLFNGGMTTALATTGGAIGGRVVKTWTANGWPFAMTCDADGKHKRIHTVTKDGVPKSWAPYRSIVIGKTLKSSDVKRVSTRIKSHVKSLKKVLSILK